MINFNFDKTTPCPPPFSKEWLYQINKLGLKSQMYQNAMSLVKEMIAAKRAETFELTTKMRGNLIFMRWYDERLAIEAQKAKGATNETL